VSIVPVDFAVEQHLRFMVASMPVRAAYIRFIGLARYVEDSVCYYTKSACVAR